MPTSMISKALNGSPNDMDIPLEIDGLASRVSSSLGTSASPVGTFPSFSHSQSKAGAPIARIGTGSFAKQLKPFATEDIKILLLENINKTGRDILTAQGYQVEALKSSLSEDELMNKIRWGRSSLPVLRRLQN